MDEEITTVQDTVDTGAQVAQPAVESETQSADVKVETETSETSQDAQQVASAPEVDDKLKKYAESQGLELDSPNAIKAAKIALANQSETTRNYQKSRELEKTMGEMSDVSATQVAQATGQDPELIKRLQRMEVKDAIRDFYDANPAAAKYDTEMTRIANEAGLYGSPEAILKAAYAMARAEDTSSVDTVRSQVKQETLQNLAHKQTAAVPTGNATTPMGGTQEKPFAELSISEMEKKLGFGNR